MEERKIEEAKFHNKVRGKELEEDKQEYKYLTSNRKFYAITRKSQRFFNNYLIQNCLGKKSLDYCCGNGDTTIFLAENGAEAIGIDISPVSIQNAKEKTQNKGLGEKASFFIMDAESLKFSNDYFDLIICAGVLHHLDIGKAYQELARVLKTGGRMICDEPLIHNPLFQLYRKLTPHLRTKWEAEHILSRGDIILAKKYFDGIEIRFFHLATLLAVPFRNTPIFNFLLAVLEKIDSLLLRLPLIKWWAWQVFFILSDPKK